MPKKSRAEYNHRYWKEHKEEIAEKRKLTREHRTAWQKQWYQTHRDEWNAYMRKRYHAKKLEEAQ